MNAIISNDDIKKIAYTLLDLFIDAGLWDDMRIYFLNCAYCTKSVSGDSEKTFTRETESGNAGQIYIIENITPNDYFSCGDILYNSTYEVIKMSQTEAQLRASKKYHEKFDNLQIRVPAGEKEMIAKHAASQGESLNSFVRRAISETIDRDTK